MSAPTEAPPEAQEKEAVKKEILEDLKKDRAFRNELLKDLELTNSSSSFSKTIQHPAILLVIGFILTSGVGAGMTYFWQKRERIESQRQAADKHEIEEKYAITESILKAVAETTTAADDLVFLYFNSEPDKHTRDLMEVERLQYWQEKSRDWRVSSKVLQQKLKDHFKSQDAQNLFQEIINKRFDIGRDLDIHRHLIKSWNWNVPEAERDTYRTGLRNILILKENMLNDMKNLMMILTKEIKEEEKLKY